MRDRPLRLPGPPLGRPHRDLRGAGDPTHVGALSLDLHLPRCGSLKDKRGAVKPILVGARQRYSVAAAEVGYQDRHQRSLLGMAAVAASPSHVEAVLDQVERFVWSHPEVEVLAAERTWMEA
ncbi:MAG: DUF503 domain-containing protein [Acidimicrobiales bacterium]